MAAHNRRRSEAEVTRERSSSEEEEESTEDLAEEEESDTESEGDKNNNPPPPKKQLASLPQHSSSDDDTESDSEMDLQPNPIRKSAPTEVKPVSLKPMGEPSQALKKSRSKPVTEVQPSGVSSKRPADSPAPKKGKDSKRAKNADEAVEYEKLKTTVDDPKKQLFQRLWSEDDEIAIMKGMIEYGEKQGIDPASVDMSSFYDFIRKSLHIDASKSQLTEKIRRLKKKYHTNLKKSKNGGDRTFSKVHDQTGYDLSKQIWGIESNGSYSAKVSKKGKNVDAKAKNANLGSPNLEKSLVTDKAKGQKNVDMEVDHAAATVAVAAAATPFSVEDFYRQAGDSSLEKGIMKYGSQLITGAKKLELDYKLKQLQMKEIEVYLQRLDYMREQAVLVLETLKSSTN
ncbi:probable transcription factor At1g11510 [Impatiens glandulifera]|uniref:probable transcription factor At1g11510 n=1 Tax=Impatiens glandulifera TaxID=253017 RepID=UPI001FB07A8B|nr:probable transcription factor At1g11510 [Impatiens glandulifera]